MDNPFLFKIKRGATGPAIEFTIGLNRDDGLTGCTADMRLRPQDDEGAITSYTLTIDNAIQGICSYQWLDSDVPIRNANTYWGEVWVTDPMGILYKLPTEVDYFEVLVVPDNT